MAGHEKALAYSFLHEVLRARRVNSGSRRMRRVIRPEEIGELAAYLLSPGAAGMTGQSILYDGSVLQV